MPFRLNSPRFTTAPRADAGTARAGDALPGHEILYASVAAAGDDPPLLAVTDAAGRPVAETGSRRGRVSGTFFHLIDRDG